ncbi:hypothetical protein V1477_013256 [Vespula maculifrons]|uniref:Uncharacterized protein n=1 Tax=Vespula maculifrons TaxID=7453 RepID=A0ABD2BVE3_VESMC
MAGVAAGSNEKARVCERVEARRSEDGVEGGWYLVGGREIRVACEALLFYPHLKYLGFLNDQ